MHAVDVPTEVLLEYKNETITQDPYFVSYIHTILRDFAPRRPGAHVLEWGTGFSTLLLYNWHIEHEGELLVSIDNNANYQKAFLNYLPSTSGFHAVIRNEIGPTLSTDDRGLHYASHPLLYGVDFDLVFIDGRRRMECALNAVLVSHANTFIVVDDGFRSRYQAIRAFCHEVAVLSHGVVYQPRSDVLDAIETGREEVFAVLSHHELRPSSH